MAFSAFSQTIVKGKVTDATTGDPLPFANVVFVGTTTGITTDFEGNYQLKTSTPVDSIKVTSVGYQTKAKAITRGTTQTVNFQLQEDVTALAEVVVLAGENPAFEILRRVDKNRKYNDKRKLEAYEYDTYTKIEIDVDNISEKLRQKKTMRKITQVLDSVERMAGEDGKPILPMFISESVSKFYFRDNPQLRYENILHSKISGVGIEDGTLVTQFIGSSFQEYNFYQNWLNIVSKEFISPIADGGRMYYEYDLTDSMYVGDHYCYRLDFFPKSPQDLAFTGTVWITKEGYALKQIDVTIGKQANLNFIEKIKIQQELEKVEGGAWLPIKNRVLIDVSELTNASAGMLAKFYTSNKNFTVNKPHEATFYQHPIVMAEDARLHEEDSFWDTLRHEPLTDTEKNVYKMIDTLQNIPVVKTYTDIIKIVVNGYYDAGKIFIGPYIGLFAVNNIEGFRLQSGFKTSYDFSGRWVFGGQLGYGFKDERFKYSAFVQNILSRDRWTTMSVRVRRDIGRVGIDDEILADNYLFLAAQRWGVFRKGYYFDEARFNFQREVWKGFSQRIAFKYMTFEPTFDFTYRKPSEGGVYDTASRFQNAEVMIESRWARDELFVQDGNDRISLGTSKWPIITVRYTRGIKGIAGSDFSYNKIRLSFYKRVRFGPLGVGYMNVFGEYMFDQAPYPLLSPHLGNQTPVYTSATFNLMRYGEFVSDRYVGLQYQHHFEGLLLNRIPLMRKLKWRLLGTANLIAGGMSKANQKLVTANEEDGIGYLTNGKPYMELGYGLENIFKFIRVDFIHRLSYLDNPDVRKFGVLVSFQFSL
ncbi:carboxypeptidase-like regulatory domain-containing protein [Pseudochryseolinea flava]|uniref:Carboxypeptidase-like regulatory domain-containing protein n=2 Tax=Pseudochryseolinea flava TaxID=2059302 RepID=A0A364XVR6_9BACT|nr:carboxypeptidase-like regulatory domain-containing protein [Pseudochryseolinea flava]